MGTFNYSKDELEINKVLKMNQDKSKSVLNDSTAESRRNEADQNISESEQLLRSLGYSKSLEGLKQSVAENRDSYVFEEKPRILDWEELTSQASSYCPETVTLEDIMSRDEIDAAFRERDHINEQFSRKTSIVNKSDLSFLTLAIAMQVTKSLVFPYVAEKFNYGQSFDPAQRLNHDDKTIVTQHKKANDSFRDKYKTRHGTGYWIEILYQTVPYDITKGSAALDINMGGKYHRLYSLGHDPVLGWIFGTANILTDCITFNSFQTNRVTRKNPISGTSDMRITSEIVPCGTMFSESCDVIKADYLNLPAALFAQAQHLKSDEYTKMGLPVPLLSTFNEILASKLYRENYDALCYARDAKIVGASFIVSKLIDMIISLAHSLFMKEDDDSALFEIRTRKILLISNSIASTSSILHATLTSNPKNLDIGSLLNTVSHLFCDIRFITRTKEEFIQSEISSKLEVELRKIDRMYDELQN